MCVESKWPDAVLINMQRQSVQTGTPQSQRVFLYPRNATAKLTAATKHGGPSAVNNWGWLAGPQYTAGWRDISVKWTITALCPKSAYVGPDTRSEALSLLQAHLSHLLYPKGLKISLPFSQTRI